MRDNKLNRLIGRLLNRSQPTFDSAAYWESRYQQGGNSGPGSYSLLSQYKAEFINQLLLNHEICSVIELGVGDGNQLSKISYPRYLGLDISKAAINHCICKFREDSSKSFMVFDSAAYHDPAGFISADLTLSLDVLYHLVEDEVYEGYLRALFGMAKKAVLIYSTDELLPQFGGHENHREFTKDVDRLIGGWKLFKVEKNPHSVDLRGEVEGSRANFFLYVRLP